MLHRELGPDRSAMRASVKQAARLLVQWGEEENRIFVRRLRCEWRL